MSSEHTQMINVTHSVDNLILTDTVFGFQQFAVARLSVCVHHGEKIFYRER